MDTQETSLEISKNIIIIAPVTALDDNFNVIENYDSAKQASEAVGTHPSNITKVCRASCEAGYTGKTLQRTAGKRWKFTNMPVLPEVIEAAKKKPTTGRNGAVISPLQLRLHTLADAMLAVVNNYCVLSEGLAESLVMWILSSYWIEEGATDQDKIQYFPRLIVTSPIPQCGKSHVLAVIEALMQDTFSDGKITEAALQRITSNELYSVVIIDEVDRALKRGNDYSDVINNGVQRGGTITICHPDDRDAVIQRKVFKPLVLAGIDIVGEGKLEAAEVERSIVLTLHKEENPPTQTIEGQSILNKYKQLQKEASTLAAEMPLVVSFPPVLSDSRARSVWKPLYSMAHMIGGDWATKLEKHYEEATSGVKEDPEHIQLIKSIGKREKTIGQLVDNEGKWVGTKDLLDALNKSSNNDLKGWDLNDKKLPNLLKSFGIEVERVRGAESNKQYRAFRWDLILDMVEKYSRE